MYYQQYQSTAALASERGEFLRKVYMNLALGFVGFIALEAFLLTWQPAVELAQKMVTGNNCRIYGGIVACKLLGCQRSHSREAICGIRPIHNCGVHYFSAAFNIC